MKKNYFYIPIILILTLIVGCEKDEISIPVQEQPTLGETNHYKTVNKEEALNLLNKRQDKSLQNIEIFYSEMRQEVLINSEEKITVIPAKTKYEGHHSRVLLMKIDNEIHPVVYSKYGKVDGDEKEFSGEIVITNLDGQFINGFNVRKGLVVSRLVMHDQNSNKTSQTCEIHSNGDAECWLQGDLDEVIVTAPHKAEPIKLREMYPPDQDTGSASPEWDGGSDGGAGSPSNPPNGEAIKIVNKLDNPCAKNIFEQLRKGEKTNIPLTTNSQIPNSLYTPLSKEILDLFNNHKTVDYEIDENNKGRNYTFAQMGKVYTILDSFYLSKATNLSIARTMIHESLHAYLLFGNSTPGSSLYQSLDIYARKNGYSHANDIHHNFMGSYINAMTYSLYVWDLNYGTGGIIDQHGNIDVNYYRAMAFGGFYKFDSNGSRIDYDSFIKLVPNHTERNNIVQIIKNEQDGSYLAKGNDC